MVLELLNQNKKLNENVLSNISDNVDKKPKQIRREVYPLQEWHEINYNTNCTINLKNDTNVRKIVTSIVIPPIAKKRTVYRLPSDDSDIGNLGLDMNSMAYRCKAPSVKAGLDKNVLFSTYNSFDNINFDLDKNTADDISFTEHLTLGTTSEFMHNIESSFDCQPFYHVYKYENRFKKNDRFSLLNQFIEDELNNNEVRFPRELELKELEQFLKPKEYFLYYVFGLDRYGYFKLRDERDRFYNTLWNQYTFTFEEDSPNTSDHSLVEESMETSFAYQDDSDSPDDFLSQQDFIFNCASDEHPMFDLEMMRDNDQLDLARLEFADGYY